MLEVDWFVNSRPVVCDIPNDIAIPNKGVWYLQLDVDIHGRANQMLVHNGPMTFQKLLDSIFMFYRMPIFLEELYAIPADALGLKKALIGLVSRGASARFVDLLGVRDGPSRMCLKGIGKISSNCYRAIFEPMRPLSHAEVIVFNLVLDRIVQCVTCT